MTSTRIIELELICAAHPGHRSSALILECLEEIKALQARLAKRQATAEKRGQFVPPSVEDVSAFFREGSVWRNGSAGLMAQSFCDHYEANGWRVGRVRMIDWKAAARGWETREKLKASPAVGRAVEPRL